MAGVHIINTPLVNSAGPKGASKYILCWGGGELQAQEPGPQTATLRQPPQFWPSGHRCQACVRLLAHQYRLHIYINRGLRGRPRRAAPRLRNQTGSGRVETLARDWLWAPAAVRGDC